VRAPMNWANTTCAAPYMRANWNIAGGTKVGMRAVLADDLSSTPELVTASTMEIVVARGDATNCSQQAGQNSCMRWLQREKLALPQGATPQSNLAVAGPLVVFRSGTKLAYARSVPLPASQSRWGYQTLPAAGGPAVTGDPAGIRLTGGLVKIYAISTAGRLMRWEFDEDVNQWVAQGIPETWEDGTPVNTTLGIAVTHGASASDGSGIFAAIPNTTGVATGQPIPVELARLVRTPVTIRIFGLTLTVNVDRWRKMIPAANRPTTMLARPGLAYAPFSPSNVTTAGRFYLTVVGSDRVARIVFTEGIRNAPSATNQRLAWKFGQMSQFTDADNQARAIPGGVTLGRFGLSAVGAAVTGLENRLAYFPSVDGIYNLSFQDVDERPFVLNNLRCSLSECE